MFNGCQASTKDPYYWFPERTTCNIHIYTGLVYCFIAVPRPCLYAWHFASGVVIAVLCIVQIIHVETCHTPGYVFGALGRMYCGDQNNIFCCLHRIQFGRSTLCMASATSACCKVCTQAYEHWRPHNHTHGQCKLHLRIRIENIELSLAVRTGRLSATIN